MLASLFARLTGRPATSGAGIGAELFGAANSFARRPVLYREGGVPDTLDGRFAALASAIGLLSVMLEHEGDQGIRASAALVERFVEVMDAEHRELGLGDPTVGKTVRKLVSLVAKRAEIWRTAIDGSRPFDAAVAESLYASAPSAPEQAVAAEQFAGWRDELAAATIPRALGRGE